MDDGALFFLLWLGFFLLFIANSPQSEKRK